MQIIIHYLDLRAFLYKISTVFLSFLYIDKTLSATGENVHGILQFFQSIEIYCRLVLQLPGIYIQLEFQSVSGIVYLHDIVNVFICIHVRFILAQLSPGQISP